MSAVARASLTIVQNAVPLPAVVMIGGCLNGFVARIVESLSVHGLGAITLGLSPFELIAVLAASRLCLRAGAAQGGSSFGWPELIALCIFLVPSSAVSWAGLAFYSAVQARRSSGDSWRGAMLFLALAVCALWSSVALKWLAAPVTAAEAFVVGKAIALLRDDIVQVGNVIGNPATHSLILMTACTTADGAPPAVLAVVSVANFLGGIDRTRAARACGCMVASYAATNLARLVAMAWSADAYALLHGPVGANLFDGVQTATVLALGTWSARR